MSKLSHEEKIAKFERETEILPGKTIAVGREIIKELRQFNHHDGAILLEKLLAQAIIRRDYDKVKQSREDWKNGWCEQREATGKTAWQVPIFSYMKEVPIDPRNFKYMALVDEMMGKFIRVIEFALKGHHV